MTITVTAHPETTPPSNTVTVSITSGYVMSALAIYRNDSNGRTLLRTQPSAGFDSRTVTDYECPYEENVTYDWTATYSDPGSASTVFDETWASTAAWSLTPFSGAWNVNSGKVRNSTTSTSGLYRSVTIAKYRVTIGSFVGGASTSRIYFNPFTVPITGAGIYLQRTSSGVLYFGFSTGSGATPTLVATTIDASSQMVVDFGATSVSITGTGGTASIAVNASMGSVYLSSIGNAANAMQVGAIKVESYAASSTLAETSSAVVLEPEDAWLIHPGTPSLSMPLSDTDMGAASIVDIAPVENVSNATVHKILGASTPIPTTTGPRSDDRTTLTIATITSAESISLRALLAPDVPLLIQIPPSWDLDFNSGFYAVGDASVERARDINQPRRTVTMPLQKVQSPVVDVENTGWSYASVAVEFAAYSDLLTSFATYADLASNSRT